MPIILELTYEDGQTERMNIPAEIWRRNPRRVNKLIVTDKTKTLTSVTVDPNWETADVNVANNVYPRQFIPSRIEAYKSKEPSGFAYRDIMADAKVELKTEEDDVEDTDNDESSE